MARWLNRTAAWAPKHDERQQTIAPTFLSLRVVGLRDHLKSAQRNSLGQGNFVAYECRKGLPSVHIGDWVMTAPCDSEDSAAASNWIGVVVGLLQHGVSVAVCTCARLLSPALRSLAGTSQYGSTVGATCSWLCHVTASGQRAAREGIC